ncbi:AP2-like ethylene-responsive transcription factor AIL1 [Rhynchospora pubera]|uniref:AP2-like ethylene-responsive transcription factor AIL1 n=1 Tax=Rhynchospora pubera TaxID=906938 RepID=A0AAV8C4I2_9POAL|nr:AP2-like ethylene-responsive transcription factor AIL1 [Rhynchospora pubera]
MAAWLRFTPPFNQADTTNDNNSTSNGGFNPLNLLSDASLGNMQHYFEPPPTSNPGAPECKYGSASASAPTCNSVPEFTEKPKLEDFLGSYYDGHGNEREINCNVLPSFSPSQTPSRCASISGMKSWLRQNAVPRPDEQTGQSCLSLSMGHGLQSDVVAPTLDEVVPAESSYAIENSDKLNRPLVERELVRRRTQTFGQRTSQYRGVTRHRWTGRYEAHLWDNTSRKEGQTRKGRQGGYDKEEKAARAYDLAALKYWGPSTNINFPLNTYEKELEEMKNMDRQEYVAHLRRNSSGFSRGASIYRGVTRHHQHGRWQARIGRVAGNKDLYLGTFSTQEEAAEAYDIAAIKFRGMNAVTNFGISKYDVNRICASTHLIGSDLAKRSPTTSSDAMSSENIVGSLSNSDDKGIDDTYPNMLLSASLGQPISSNGGKKVEILEAFYNTEHPYVLHYPDDSSYGSDETSPAWQFLI